MATAKAGESEFAALPLPGKLFILVLILALMAGAYYALFFTDMKEQLQGARSQQQNLETTLEDARSQQKAFLARREEMVGREALDRQNLRVLPEDAEIPGFLDDLNRLAELSGLRTEKIHIESEQPADLYVKVPVSLVMDGQFHQLAKFFYNVSRLERAISMENIELQRGGEKANAKRKGDEVPLRVHVRATTYRRAGAKG